MRVRGFTLIELVMIILLLGVLAAVAIPEFIDFRKDARNAAVQGGLGGMRSAIAIARAAIAMREDSATPIYPTLLEMQNNAYNGSHPVLNGTAIMDKSSGIPKNPWTLNTLPNSHFNTIIDCTGKAQGVVLASPLDDRGWCYNPVAGQIWANSDRNGGPVTENAF